MPHDLSAPKVRLGDIPNLRVSQFLALIQTAPTSHLQIIWDRYGADRHGSRCRGWTLPRTLAGVDVWLAILRRLRPADFAEPPEDPTAAVEPPGPWRVREYEERRAVERPTDSESTAAKARASGLLGYGVFSRLDYLPAQAYEAVVRSVHRLRNGHPVADEEEETLATERADDWTVAAALKEWRDGVKPRLWPESAHPEKIAA